MNDERKSDPIEHVVLLMLENRSLSVLIPVDWAAQRQHFSA
jgi:hypothetical protein